MSKMKRFVKTLNSKISHLRLFETTTDVIRLVPNYDEFKLVYVKLTKLKISFEIPIGWFFIVTSYPESEDG